MKPFIVTQTKRNNKYTYFRSTKELYLSHPLLAHMFELHNRGVNLEEWKEKLLSSSFKQKEIDYYYKKFILLTENNYLTNENTSNNAAGQLSPQSIEMLLANTRQVTFEVTDRCSMACKYCGYGSFYQDYDDRENKNLPFGTARRLLDFLANYWNSAKNISHDKNIYIGFYGGEPLMNMPFVREAVSYIKSMKMIHNRFSFAITSNGLLLEEYMDFLVENDFNLLVSLDGDRESSAYRVLKNGKEGYEQIIKNVNALKEKHPGYFRKKVNFNAVFHNKNTVDGIFAYFKENFGKAPAINEISTSGINPERKDEFLETYSSVSGDLSQSKDYQTLEQELFVNLPTIKSMTIFLHQYSGCAFRDYPSLVFPHKKAPRIPTGTCAPFSRKLFLSVNGKIFPCERIGHRFSLGHVGESDVELDPRAIANYYNGLFNEIRRNCQHCYNIDACQACIFHMEFENGKPKCVEFMDNDKFSRHLSRHLSHLEEHPHLYKRIMEEVIGE